MGSKTVSFQKYGSQFTEAKGSFFSSRNVPDLKNSRKESINLITYDTLTKICRFLIQSSTLTPYYFKDFYEY